MRIGLYGGTFNPIHLAHLRSVQEIKEQFSLDRIYLIPSARPPHKKNEIIPAAEDRFEMASLAVSGRGDLKVSDIEINRSGPSYSIDTVKYFLSKSTPGTKFFFILGTDAFFELETWKSYKNLLEISPLIIMIRPENLKETKSNIKINMIDRIKSYLHDIISENYFFDLKKSCFTHDIFQSVFYYEVTQLNISSTNIRNLMAQKKSIKYLVPEKIEEYIYKKGLYK